MKNKIVCRRKRCAISHTPSSQFNAFCLSFAVCLQFCMSMLILSAGDQCTGIQSVCFISNHSVDVFSHTPPAHECNRFERKTIFNFIFQFCVCHLMSFCIHIELVLFLTCLFSSKPLVSVRAANSNGIIDEHTQYVPMCHKNFDFIHFHDYFIIFSTVSHATPDPFHFAWDRTREWGTIIQKIVLTFYELISCACVYVRVSAANTTYECDCDVSILKLVVSIFPSLSSPPPCSLCDCEPYCSTTLNALTISAVRKIQLRFIAPTGHKVACDTIVQLYLHISMRNHLPGSSDSMARLRMIVKTKINVINVQFNFFPHRVRDCHRFCFLFATPEYGLETKCYRMPRACALCFKTCKCQFHLCFFFRETVWIYDELNHNFTRILTRSAATLDVFIANKFTLIQQLWSTYCLSRGLNDATHMKCLRLWVTVTHLFM